jgi:hypothetical protein
MDHPAHRPKLLLHACCGVCSAYVPELLIPDYDVTIYFENSNIYPSDEFRKRADAAREMAKQHGIPFIEVSQDEPSWYRAVQGHAQDRENGERCAKCMAFRLDHAFAYAKEHGFDVVACTLGVSRRKKIDMVHAVGKTLSEKYGIPFLDRDWKKGGGEDESQRRAKEAGIYRQEYCGCVYSRVSRDARIRRIPSFPRKSLGTGATCASRSASASLAVLFVMAMTMVFGIGCARSQDETTPVIGSALPLPYQDALEKVSEVFAWKRVAEGVDRAKIAVPQGEWRPTLVVYRFDPSQYHFNFAHNQTAQSIRAWRDELADAKFIMNGVYFHEDGTPSGALRIRGTDISSRAFDADKAGLIVFDGAPKILDTADQPHAFDSTSSSAQSYPFLIKDGVPAVKEDSELLARRSFIGMDWDGLVYLGVYGDGEISLYGFGELLKTLPITWTHVLNLDGGPSTSFVSKFPDAEEIEDGYSAIPNVIVVTKK